MCERSPSVALEVFMSSPHRKDKEQQIGVFNGMRRFCDGHFQLFTGIVLRKIRLVAAKHSITRRTMKKSVSGMANLPILTGCSLYGQ